MQEGLQDFSIFHHPYDSNKNFTTKRDDDYKFENADNFAKVQQIRMKSQVSAVRPFLYLQEEGEIVMVKLIGKKWIVIGAKALREDGTSRGHITVWERSNQDNGLPGAENTVTTPNGAH